MVMIGRGIFCFWIAAAMAQAQAQTPPAQPATATPPATPSAQPPSPPQDDGGWSRMLARRDLRAARAIIAENSPILHVERDSAAMRRWLDEGYQKALAMLPLVSNEIGYRFLINYYLRGFRDGHISAGNHDNYQPAPIASRGWPGIAMAWRNGRYEVAFVAPWVEGPPAVGSELIGCDGRSAEELARSRIDLFDADLDKPLQRRHSAFRLLWDRSNPFVQNPQICQFRPAQGPQQEVRLQFRALEPDEARSRAATAAVAAANAPELGVTPWGGRSWWIAIPSLQGGSGWEPLFQKIEENIRALRSADVVVIDVRGNGGGSSAYADRLAKSLWGAELVEARRPVLGRIAWRATPVVRDHLEGLIDLRGGNPTEAASVSYWRGLVSTLDRTMAAGQPLYVQNPDNRAPRSSRPSANPMRARVIVLTDERCFSACLDLMDLFMAMPNVAQAGQPTGADTIFMDNYGAVLPSGRIALTFGVKAWLDRPRGSNVSYSPAAEWLFTGDLGDDNAWRTWLAEKIRRPRRR